MYDLHGSCLLFRQHTLPTLPQYNRVFVLTRTDLFCWLTPLLTVPLLLLRAARAELESCSQLRAACWARAHAVALSSSEHTSTGCGGPHSLTHRLAQTRVNWSEEGLGLG